MVGTVVESASMLGDLETLMSAYCFVGLAVAQGGTRLAQTACPHVEALGVGSRKVVVGVLLRPECQFQCQCQCQWHPRMDRKRWKHLARVAWTCDEMRAAGKDCLPKHEYQP